MLGAAIAPIAALATGAPPAAKLALKCTCRKFPLTDGVGVGHALTGGGEGATSGSKEGIGGIGNGLIKPAHAAVVRAPGSGAGGVVGAAEVLPCVPCAGSGVCAGTFSDGVADSGSIVFVSSRNLVRVRNRLVLVCVSRGNSRCA